MRDSIESLTKIKKGNEYIRIPLSKVINTSLESVNSMIGAVIRFEPELEIIGDQILTKFQSQCIFKKV